MKKRTKIAAKWKKKSTSRRTIPAKANISQNKRRLKSHSVLWTQNSQYQFMTGEMNISRSLRCYNWKIGESRDKKYWFWTNSYYDERWAERKITTIAALRAREEREIRRAEPPTFPEFAGNRNWSEDREENFVDADGQIHCSEFDRGTVAAEREIAIDEQRRSELELSCCCCKKSTGTGKYLRM